MKKTMVFENETAYDNWFDVNEEKEGGHDFLENRVVIIKETRTINGKKFNGFSADSTIECKNVRTAVRRFVKELNSNGFEVSVDELEGSCNGKNLHDLSGSGMVVEVEEIDDGVFYVNYMCYQDEVEEEIETEETTEESEATETEMKTATDLETAETETATESEPETATDTEDGEFVYDVGIHNFYECRTYTVRADNPESAAYKALKRMKNGKDDKEYYSIDFIRIHKENSEKKSELNTKYGVLADDQFHHLTKTLIKSLFKAIGIEETRKIHFTISNNMVFFNYNGKQYKYYPSQCKVFEKCGRKYQRINWKNFAEENKPDGQKQNSGRSPPFTPDIRSINIDKFKIKE